MARFTRYKRKLFVAFIAALLMSCGGNNHEPSPVDNNKDRKEILMHWVDSIVVPSYEKFKVKFDSLKSKADAFTQTPDVSSLAEFRAAWVEAYLEWQKVEVFEFGPADQYTLRNFFNIYPTDISGIAANISDPSINLDLP